jgi:toxin ParE1/3/4
MAFRLTPLADADLVEIAEYTALHWGDAQALRYAATFSLVFAELGNNPYPPISRKRDDLLTGCRVFAVEKHFVIYRRAETVTDILRVLHQRMNLSLHRLI